MDFNFPTELLTRLDTPLHKFLLQVLLVLLVAKIAGRCMRLFKQPAVIGEMIAGIFLGPSLFGWLLPSAHSWLFPANGLSSLNHVSQLGVLIFMFTAGAEWDMSRLKEKFKSTAIISQFGIFLPFVMGLGLASFLYSMYAPVKVSLFDFSLFVGISLSVTAFPVLLRIIEDRGYKGSEIATVAIACAAIADASAWALLGIIVATVQSQSITSALLCAFTALAYAWILIVPGRRFIAKQTIDEQNYSRWLVILVVAILSSAMFTELIGLHLLFGAFLAGIAVSSNQVLRNIIVEKIEPFAGALLLPLFFAQTGLNTRIDMLNAKEWLLCLLITGLATLGKLGGTALAARVSGLSTPDSWRLGALMNTRGLMELIVLGIGLQLGLISQNLYAILVLVAIITTIMTGPLLGLIDRISKPNLLTGI
ncbi:MAG: cation:proton antiporter [Arenimonas sp.]